MARLQKTRKTKVAKLPNKQLKLRALLLVFVVLFALVGVVLLYRSNAAVVTGQNRYGISNGGLAWLGSADQAKKMDQMKAMGARWVRTDMRWDLVQPTGPSTYNWTAFDNIVNNAKARNLQVLFILTYTPSWARPSGCSGADKCGPANPQDFANFAGAAAARYGPMGVHDFEIWNEPNIPQFWAPTPNVAQYTTLLKLSYSAIHAADPAANVLSGGTSPAGTSSTSYSPVDFLKGIYANGGKGYFDNLSHHPYCYHPGFNCPTQYAEWSAWSQMQDTTVSLRSLMVSNGDGGKQIWATEFGAPTKGYNSITEAEQAKMVTDAYKLFSSYSWAGPLFYYSDADHCSDTNDRECWFGLLRQDGTRKPAYDAYLASANAAGGSTSDTVSPTVSLVAPTNGATVSGMVQVQASSNDNIGVTKVEFYLDNTLFKTETTAPYCMAGDDGTVCSGWDSRSVSDGSHTISAKAYDAAGNTAAASVTFTVKNTQPTATYSVSGIVSKSGGGTLGGVKVSIYNSSINRATTTSGNGQFSFANIPSGSYTISFNKKKYQVVVQPLSVTSGNVVRNVTLSPY